VSDLETAFAQLLGRTATDKEKQDLHRVKTALNLRDSDSTWLLLMVLGHYENLYGRFPKLIADAARDVMSGTKQTAEAQALASTEQMKATLAKAVHEAAVASAQKAAGAHLARWVAIAAAVVAVSLIGTGWMAFRKGRETGYGTGTAEAYRRVADDKAAAAWTSTPDGQLAWGLAQAGSIRQLATCGGRGWVAKDNVCYPQPDRGKIVGWRLAIRAVGKGK